jgi:glutamate 5-kinase
MRIVVKLGTSTLTGGGKKLKARALLKFAEEITELTRAGHELILVSSGAVAAGREVLMQQYLAKHIPAKQMLAAIGQPRLMHRYSELFGLFDLPVAQVLLTRDDIEDRKRYLNARDMLDALLKAGVLPIINENDAVSVAEIKLGDNDQLSAWVANLVQADRLVLVTDCDGLFDKDPREHADAQLVESVHGAIPAALWQAAGGSVSGLGTGGMSTKLLAADIARAIGCDVLIVNGAREKVLSGALFGDLRCTRFFASQNAQDSRKRFLLTQPAAGEIAIDHGASLALQQGKSLLAAGLQSLSGSFERGDVVRIRAADKDIARGVIRYSSSELQKLFGAQSSAIAAILGYSAGGAIVHRNDLVMLSAAE